MDHGEYLGVQLPRSNSPDASNTSKEICMPIIVKGIEGFLDLRKEKIEQGIVEDSQSLNEQDTYVRDLFERRVEDARRLCAGGRATRRS